MKKSLAQFLSILIALLAPGFAPYEAFAQVVRGPAPVEGGIPLESAPLELGAPLGSESALPMGEQALSAAPLAGESLGTAIQPQTAQRTQTIERTAGARAVPSARPAPTAAQAVPAMRGLSAAQESKRGESGAQASPERDLNGALFDRARPNAPAYVDEKAYEGQTLLITGSLASRPWILDGAKRFADEHGMKLAIVDSKEQRKNSIGIVPDDHFIEGNVDDHSQANTAAILDKVETWAKGRTVALTQSFLNQYALLASQITGRIGSKGDPVAGVEMAHDKAQSDKALAERAPTIRPPSRRVDSAEEARAAFAEIAGPGGKVVIKPIKGGGSQGVVVDVDSPEKAAQTWTKVDAFLREFVKLPDAGHSNLDQYPGILMQHQLEGAEIDAEFVTRKGADGRPVVDFFMVSDNPPMEKPYAVEKGATFPSQLPPAILGQIREAGLLALEAHGLSEGNSHIEMIVTPQGPKILEVNKRMGGLFVKPLVESITGFNLVEGALRAYLGLAPKTASAPKVTLEVRMAISKVGGVIEKLEGIEEAERMPGVERVVPLKKAGDTIRSPEKDMFDYPLYLSATGANYDEAFANLQAAMRTIKLHVRLEDGTVSVQSADLGHVKVDPNAILAQVQAEQANRATGSQDAGREAPQPEDKLNRSFFTFLGGVTLMAMVQEAIAVLKPLFAGLVGGVGFAVLTQAIEQAARIPGSMLGAKFTSKFDPRALYIVANVVNGLAFASLPLVVIFAPSASLVGFVSYSIVSGISYGMTRGVGENAMPPRILGQSNKTLLEKAGNLYFVFVEPAAFASAFLIATLGIGAGAVLTTGVHVAAAAAGVVLALTAIPFIFVKFKKQSLKKEEGGRHGNEDHLPLKTYLPYAFFQFMHQAFYSLLSWMIAGEVMHNKALTGSFTGLYDMGSFLLVSALLLAPVALKKLGIKLLPNWTEKQWTIAAAVPVALFVWGSLLSHSPVVALPAALLLGAATTVANVKWKPVFQNRLKLEAQPRVFQNLMIAAVLGSLVPFLVIKGSMALNLGIPLMTLLNVVAVLVTIAGAGMIWSVRKGAQDPAAAPKDGGKKSS
jgi:biotin carboxylase